MRASSAYRVPDSIDFPVAASFLTTYGTSFHTLSDRAKLQPGETLLVLGAAGGVGLAAVELGAAMGAHVIAAARPTRSSRRAAQHGAEATVNYSTLDLKSWLKEHTGGKGVDVVYDPVGGDLSEPALRAIRWEGRFLVVGFVGGIPRIPLNLPLLKGCSVMAFLRRPHQPQPRGGTRDGRRAVCDVRDGRIDPMVCANFPLDPESGALRELMDRKVIGKAVVLP